MPISADLLLFKHPGLAMWTSLLPVHWFQLVGRNRSIGVFLDSPKCSFRCKSSFLLQLASMNMAVIKSIHQELRFAAWHLLATHYVRNERANLPLSRTALAHRLQRNLQIRCWAFPRKSDALLGDPSSTWLASFPAQKCIGMSPTVPNSVRSLCASRFAAKMAANHGRTCGRRRL